MAGMGYMIVIGECFGCGRVFGFHPVHVPSIPVNGVRQPVCEACIVRANPQRIANGLEPVVPHPDAYEPAEDGFDA